MHSVVHQYKEERMFWRTTTSAEGITGNLLSVNLLPSK